MKKAVLNVLTVALLTGLSINTFANPQKMNGLYVNTFGDNTNPAIIFVHGGPGYDSQDFEYSTAAPLSAQGYYVVVYDQRGQGRSDLAQSPTDYTYKQYADDLKMIVDQLGLKKPALIGHSHGGPISLKFDQFCPGVVSKIILVSGPIDFFRSLDSLRTNCSARYAAANDSADNSKLQADFSVLNGSPTLDSEVGALADVFQLALNKPCALYSPAQPTPEAAALHQTIASHHVAVPQENLVYPMGNFVVNEQYIRVDQTQWVKNNADHIYGIYGSEDGLFAPTVLASIQDDLASNPSAFKFQLIMGASHAVYIDQQAQFIQAVINDLK